MNFWQICIVEIFQQFWWKMGKGYWSSSSNFPALFLYYCRRVHAWNFDRSLFKGEGGNFLWKIRRVYLNMSNTWCSMVSRGYSYDTKTSARTPENKRWEDSRVWTCMRTQTFVGDRVYVIDLKGREKIIDDASLMFRGLTIVKYALVGLQQNKFRLYNHYYS